MKIRRTTSYLIIDIAIGLLFLLETLSGIVLAWVLTGGYQGGRNLAYGRIFIMNRDAWLGLHDWVGLAMAALVVLHVALHWRWIVGVFKGYARRFYRSDPATKTAA